MTAPREVIRALETSEDLQAGFRVLREFRTHLSADDFAQIYAQARAMDGYTFYGLFEPDGLCAVMGCRIQYDFARGKHLYIDDLVTTAARRSSGAGRRLLAHADIIRKTRPDFGCSDRTRPFPLKKAAHPA